MPYQVVNDAPNCGGFAVVKVGETNAIDGGCHQSEFDAIAHMNALNIATADDQRAVDLTPTTYMIDNCKRGLEYHQQGKSGDGLKPQTVRDANKIAAGQPLSIDKLTRMRAWIARHMVDLEGAPNPNDKEYPSPGQVAHLLWASGTNREQAQKTYDWCETKMNQIENEQNNQNNGQELRQLPPSYRPSASEDVPVVRPSCMNCEYSCAVVDLTQMVTITSCKRWNAEIALDQYCDAWEAKEESEHEMESEMEMESAMQSESDDVEQIMEYDSQPTSTWVTRSVDDKRSLAFTNIECRAIGDGNTLVGYASMFDTPSHDLGGFTEYVARGAFTKTLKDGADVRLLIDHEGAPLARTKSNTMRLVEDERGLRVEADLDPSNPRAAEIISALKRGDMNQMSFAFRVIRDEWSKDRATRTLKEVRLFDVSVVTFPAYEATIAEIRNASIVDNDDPVVSRLNLRKRQVQIATILK
jgi:HK97 family phage prohead protease